MGRFFFFYSFLCFVLLISECFSSSFDHHLCSPTEASALLQFKQPLKTSYYSSFQCDTSLPKTKFWNESKDCCTWDGVTCDMLTGHVINLDLSCSQLFGIFHPNSSLFRLHHLQTLNLAYNHFYSSSIPHNIGRLRNLRHLNLSHSYFYGKIPTEISYLSNLVSLDLSSNNITIDAGLQITFPCLEVLQLSSCELKDFPHFLRNVKTLIVLDISNNKICGQIPNWFNGMRWDLLRFLNLSHNSLSGHLPKFRYHNLEYLDLKFNSLQGPPPSSICNLTKLGILDLSRNNFSNSIPSCLGSMPNLRVLDLRRNNFTGSIPPLCAQNTSLRTIVLNGNRFEGPVPMSLLNCNGLEILDVGNNVINGTFPAWLGTHRELQVLKLNSNKFHGPISTRKKFYFPRLRIFDLSHNEFSGSLPAQVFRNFKPMIKLDDRDKGEIDYMRLLFDCEFGDITYEDSVRLVIKGHDIELERINTIVTAIDLSSNHFEGVIPKILKDLSSLSLLNLSHNNLIGNIPMELGQMNMLEVLDLSWNRLTGKIPQQLARLTFLAFLNLSQNHLVGPIPRGPLFIIYDSDAYGGNLDLCGFPLSMQCETSEHSHTHQSLYLEDEEDESYFESGFTWESMLIGYSCGLVVGTVVFKLMLNAGKPKWLVKILDDINPQQKRRPKKRAHRRQT